MKTIEKLRIKTTLKMGPKVYLEGEIYTFPHIDPQLIYEVRMKTGTIEVLSWMKVVSQDSDVTSAGETSSVFMNKEDIPEPEPEPEVESEVEVEPEVESEVEPELKSKPKSKSKTKPKSKTTRKTKPKSGLKLRGGA